MQTDDHDELDDRAGRPLRGRDADDDTASWDPLGVARLRVRTIWLTLALLTVLAIGAVYGHRLVQDDLDGRIGRALQQEGLADVEVELEGRAVTLTGSVASAADADLAAETVRGVKGIKGLTVDLTIGEPSP